MTKKYFGKLGSKHLFKLVSGQHIGFFELIWMRVVLWIIKGWKITLTN